MKRQHGFGLIEVMLAFVIVAATAGTLLQLNKTYLEYSRDGRSREVAMRLAESKLDELRRFQSRNGFDEITDGSDTVNLDNNEYARNWAVTESGNAQKQVVVTINWNDGGEVLSFTLGTTISLNISAISGSLGTANKHLGTGKGGPKVKHTPGLFPDVVAIDLGDGLKQETSKPVVTVAKNDSTSVRVSEKTTLYDAANIKVQEQDLVTVSCNCKLSGSADAELPAQRTMVGALAYWKNGDNALKQTGKAKDNKQDKLCNLCCKNHFDGPSNEFSHWYDVIKWKYAEVKNAQHAHYSSISGSTIVADGDEYLEACRLVRIDGVYKVANDWNLVVLNVFSEDYLIENKNDYEEYVSEVVVGYVLKQIKSKVGSGYQYDVASYSPGPFSQELKVDPSSSTKLVVRGIYVDIFSPDYLDALNAISEGKSVNELINSGFVGKLAFEERKVRNNLIEWTISSDVASIDQGSSELKAHVKGETSVTANILRSNSGLTTNIPISPFEESNDWITAELTVEVTAP
ncbi:type II secretion system protein [Oceanimonas sp. AH20CE76]|uniref:type II secretion system protein n=1 Tax=Oceanimonas sp. AH20CE76 TaxID=2977120 RepID=UPI0031FE7893